MDEPTTNLKDAKARLSELIDRACAGETVNISKRGKIVARLTASTRPREPIDLDDLRALTRRLPEQGASAETMMRELREDARY
jgi:prevent-host-death family protein